MTDITRIASEHARKSQNADEYELNRAFNSDMDAVRRTAAIAVEIIEASMKHDREIITNAVKATIRDMLTLTAADIADMQARCDETDSAEQYSTATEGHW